MGYLYSDYKASGLEVFEFGKQVSIFLIGNLVAVPLKGLINDILFLLYKEFSNTWRN